MATKTEVEWIDDLDSKTPLGEGDAKGFRFAVDGTVYEIDMTEQHASALRKALSKYVDKARKIGKLPTSGPYVVQGGSRAPAQTAHRREVTKIVRTWARANGWPNIADRGRIPADVLEAYTARAKIKAAGSA